MNNGDLKLYDIYDMVYLPWWKTLLFFYFLWFCFVSIVLVLMYYIYRYYVRKKPKSFREKSYDSLDEIIKLKNSSNTAMLYSRLTILVKSVIQFVYKISVIDKTDEELLCIIVKNEALSNVIILAIQKLFTHSTEIKFACYYINEEQISEMCSLAHVILDESFIYYAKEIEQKNKI